MRTFCRKKQCGVYSMANWRSTQFRHWGPSLPRSYFLFLPPYLLSPLIQLAAWGSAVSSTSGSGRSPPTKRILVIKRRELISPYQPPRSLRSSSQLLLTVPRANLTIGQRAFCHSSPSIWNSIPLSVREAPSVSTFKRCLKSFYFNSLVS